LLGEQHAVLEGETGSELPGRINRTQRFAGGKAVRKSMLGVFLLPPTTSSFFRAAEKMIGFAYPCTVAAMTNEHLRYMYAFRTKHIKDDEFICQ